MVQKLGGFEIKRTKIRKKNQNSRQAPSGRWCSYSKRFCTGRWCSYSRRYCTGRWCSYSKRFCTGRWCSYSRRFCTGRWCSYSKRFCTEVTCLRLWFLKKNQENFKPQHLCKYRELGRPETGFG